MCERKECSGDDADVHVVTSQVSGHPFFLTVLGIFIFYFSFPSSSFSRFIFGEIFLMFTLSDLSNPACLNILFVCSPT